MSKRENGYLLPSVCDAERLCVVVRVPNEQRHILAFLGQISALSYWYNWQRDEAHTARCMAKTWAGIFDEVSQGIQLSKFNCPQEPLEGGCGGCEDDCMGCGNLKFVNGVLGCDCCGTFIPVPGQSGNGSQPGPGSPLPAPGGGQQAYNGCLDASKVWVLPPRVSTGDTISLESASGAWNDPDADGPFWRVQSGLRWYGGPPIPGTTILVGTDPLPTAPHMGFVLQINGTFYDFSGGAFTVPGGISNAQVTLQANDSNLANDNGNICFVLNVVNNQVPATTWSHDFLGGHGLGGWTVADGSYNSALDSLDATFAYTSSEFLGDLSITIPATNITKLSLTIEKTTAIGGFRDAIILNGGAPIYDTGSETGTFTLDASGLPASITTIDGHVAGDTSGDAKLRHIHIEGTGTDPF